MSFDVLTEREQEILESVVQHFVLTGCPVGSRTLAKKQNETLSSASIRNVMADLEEKGYLDHPHTSAGRRPTTMGYRHYVDNLVDLTDLSNEEKVLFKKNIGDFSGDIDFILEKTLQVLVNKKYAKGTLLNTKLKSMTDIKKLIGAKQFDKILTDHILKPQGKPTLVPNSDKRQKLNSAKDDFEQEELI